MLKTLSATPAREPEPAHRRGAPGDPSETTTPEEYPVPPGRTRSGVGAARQRGSSLRVTSNLTEPAGVLTWERDFLLGLAINVLEDFVGNTDEQDGEHNGGSDDEHE